MFGGMIAPPVLTALVRTDAAQNWFYVPIVYMIYGTIAILALLFLRETPHVILEELDGTMSEYRSTSPGIVTQPLESARNSDEVVVRGNRNSLLES
jgi:hypothetical protein